MIVVSIVIIGVYLYTYMDSIVKLIEELNEKGLRSR